MSDMGVFQHFLSTLRRGYSFKSNILLPQRPFNVLLNEVGGKTMVLAYFTFSRGST